MNIYLVSWIQGGLYELSAVVIDTLPSLALSQLKLDMDNCSDVEISKIGFTTSEPTVPRVVCEESL